MHTSTRKTEEHAAMNVWLHVVITKGACLGIQVRNILIGWEVYLHTESPRIFQCACITNISRSNRKCALNYWLREPIAKIPLAA